MILSVDATGGSRSYLTFAKLLSALSRSSMQLNSRPRVRHHICNQAISLIEVLSEPGNLAVGEWSGLAVSQAREPPPR